MDPLSSPVAKQGTVRSLVYRSDRGQVEEVISMIDISYAFLQSTRYGPEDEPRYVSLKASRDSKRHVFRLLGPVYGQRSAPKAWYDTLSTWLVSVGYTKSKNDQCLFVSKQGHQLVVHVDDILCRGTVADSVEFYNKLGAQFDCKDPEWLDGGGSLCYTGLDIERTVRGSEDWYYLSQVSELQEMLDDAELLEVEERESPMPDGRKMLQDRSIVGPAVQAWCRTLIGALDVLARCTRWDVSHAVATVSSDMKEPTAGTVRALEHIAGYLIHTSGMRLAGKRSSARNQYVTYVDSDHHGDPAVSTRQR
jgi:hypothetical protein